MSLAASGLPGACDPPLREGQFRVVEKENMEEQRARASQQTNGTAAVSHCIPRLFKAQPVAFGVLQALAMIARPSAVSFVWAALTGFAIWKSLRRSRAASLALSAMLVVDALALYAVASGIALRSLVMGGVVLAFGVYLLVVADYLIMSPPMRAFFRKSIGWTGAGSSSASDGMA